MAAQTYEGAFREAGTCLECAMRPATRGDFCDYCAAGGKDEAIAKMRAETTEYITNQIKETLTQMFKDLPGDEMARSSVEFHIRRFLVDAKNRGYDVSKLERFEVRMDGTHVNILFPDWIKGEQRTMQLHPVESSNIAAVGHDPDTNR